MAYIADPTNPNQPEDTDYVGEATPPELRAIKNHIINRVNFLLAEIADGDTETAQAASTALAAAVATLTGQITAVNTAITTHAGLTNNPHAVTKAQVGLSNVENYTATDSVTDNATDKYLVAKAAKTLKDQLDSLATTVSTLSATVTAINSRLTSMEGNYPAYETNIANAATYTAQAQAAAQAASTSAGNAAASAYSASNSAANSASSAANSASYANSANSNANSAVATANSASSLAHSAYSVANAAATPALVDSKIATAFSNHGKLLWTGAWANYSGATYTFDLDGIPGFDMAKAFTVVVAGYAAVAGVGRLVRQVFPIPGGYRGYPVNESNPAVYHSAADPDLGGAYTYVIIDYYGNLTVHFDTDYYNSGYGCYLAIYQ